MINKINLNKKFRNNQNMTNIQKLLAKDNKQRNQSKD